MEKGFVSIIVPVYNVENYLEQCLDSLINQSYQNIEIIIIDDGSTDDSRKIIERYKIMDKRIKTIFKENEGVSAARNDGIKNAQGDYILFVDGDDWIDLDTCIIGIKEMEESNADVVMWGYIREYGEHSLKNKYLGESKISWDNDEVKTIWRRMIGPIKEELHASQKLDSVSTVWGKMYRKKLIENSSFVDINIIGIEDVFYNIQVFKNLCKVVYLPETLYHYRKENTISLTHSYKKNKIKQWRELYKRIYCILKDNQASKEYFCALNNRICLGIIGLGINLAEDKKMSFMDKKHELNSILNINYYQKALKRLDSSYFLTHWKFFFFCAENKFTLLLLVILYTMNKLRSMR